MLMPGWRRPWRARRGGAGCPFDRSTPRTGGSCDARGSQHPTEGALPVELHAVVDGDGELDPGVTEWMVHPGYPDRDSGSGYDRAREEDLDLLLSLCLLPALRGARLSHGAAFA
jgi:hypothetical protein